MDSPVISLRLNCKAVKDKESTYCAKYNSQVELIRLRSTYLVSLWP